MVIKAKNLIKRIIPEIALRELRNRKQWKPVRSGEYLAGPEGLNCFVTDRCNLRCRMCANHRSDMVDGSALNHNTVRDMSAEVFEKVLDTFPSIKKVTFAGVGEPMLAQDLFRMVKIAGGRGLCCGMVSNGTRLNVRMEELLDSPLSEISFSLNAAGADKYAEITGMTKETFFEVSDSIKKLIGRRNAINKKMRIAVSAVLKRSSLNEAQDIYRYAASLGVDRVSFHNYIPDPSREGDMSEYVRAVDKKELLGIQNACKNLGQKSGIAMPVPVVAAPQKKCLSYFRNMNVDGEGNVGGCMRVLPPSRENGNILLEGKDVWTNEYFKRHRGFYLDKKALLPVSCRYCVENS